MSAQTKAPVLVIGRFPFGVRQISACLNRAGYQVFAACTTEAVKAGMSRHIRDRQIVPDQSFLAEDPSVELAVRDAACKFGAELIVPSDLETTRWLGETMLEGLLKFPCPPKGALDRIHDKSRLVALAEAAGVNNPPTVLVRSVADLDSAEFGAAEFDGPLITKPIDEGNGDFVDSWPTRAAVVEGMKRHFGATNPPPRLVQQAIEGWDVDASGLAVDGRLISVFTQRHHKKPFRREFVWNEDAAQAASKLVETSGHNGPIDFGFRCDARTGQLSVIDCNPRFTASTLMKQFGGWNLPAIGADLLLQGVQPVWAPQKGEQRSSFSFTPSWSTAAYLNLRLFAPRLRPTRQAWTDLAIDAARHRLSPRT